MRNPKSALRDLTPGQAQITIRNRKATSRTGIRKPLSAVQKKKARAALARKNRKGNGKTTVTATRKSERIGKQKSSTGQVAGSEQEEMVEKTGASTSQVDMELNIAKSPRCADVENDNTQSEYRDSSTQEGQIQSEGDDASETGSESGNEESDNEEIDDEASGSEQSGTSKEARPSTSADSSLPKFKPGTQYFKNSVKSLIEQGKRVNMKIVEKEISTQATFDAMNEKVMEAKRRKLGEYEVDYIVTNGLRKFGRRATKERAYKVQYADGTRKWLRETDVLKGAALAVVAYIEYRRDEEGITDIWKFN